MANITILSPNGGNQWAVGSSKRIRWESSGVNNVKIEISKDGGNFETIVESIENINEYLWVVTTPTGNAVIKVSDVDSNAFDVSDSPFTIGIESNATGISLLSPNGSEEWEINSTQEILWDTGTNISASIKIELSRNGDDFTELATVSDTGSYLWDVSGDTGEALIRVSDAGDSSLFDISASPFTITGPSTLQIDDLSVDPISENDIASLTINYSDSGIFGHLPPIHTINVNWGDGESDSIESQSKSQYVIGICIDGLRPSTITALGVGSLPNLYRFRSEGVYTDNARADYGYTETLPNLTNIVTSTTPAIHGMTVNAYTDGSGGLQAVTSLTGGYVYSVWDMVHDAGFRTALYAQKQKIIDLFVDTWNELGESGGTNVEKIDIVRSEYSGSAPIYNADALIDQFILDSSGYELNAQNTININVDVGNGVPNSEISGIAASTDDENVFFIHNDSGETSPSGRFFAINENGDYLREYIMNYHESSSSSGNISQIDFEDCAVGPGPNSNNNYLYIADIGDNGFNRDGSTNPKPRIYRIVVPRISSDHTTTDSVDIQIDAELMITYPGNQPKNAETFFIDPITGDGFIVTKIEDVVSEPLNPNSAEVYIISKEKMEADENEDGIINIQLDSGDLVATLNNESPGGVWINDNGISCGAISNDGKRIILCDSEDNGTYTNHESRIWYRDITKTIAQTFTDVYPKAVLMGSSVESPKCEGVCFGLNNYDYYTISEVNSNMVKFSDVGVASFSFIHLRAPDSEAHDHNFGSTEYNNAIVGLDAEIGRVLDLVDNHPDYLNSTTIILTADHGGVAGSSSHADETLQQNYTVPFYVYGNSTKTALDLYNYNSTVRTNPGSGRSEVESDETDPIYNGDLANLACDLLGLDVIDNSVINQNLDLAVGSSFQIVLTHRYLDNPSDDSYTIDVEIADDNGGRETGSITIQVNNEAPIIVSAVTSVDGDTGDATLVLEFTDVGSLDTFTVDVEWGDGSSNQYNYDSSGTKSISHTYSVPPSSLPFNQRYFIKVTVTDDDGGSDYDESYNIVLWSGSSVSSAYGLLSGNSNIQYNESVEDDAYSEMKFGRFIAPYFPHTSDSEAIASLDGLSFVDHTSVFVVLSDIGCSRIGNTRFEDTR